MKKLTFIWIFFLSSIFLYSFEINEKNIYSYFKDDIENLQNFEILKTTYAKLLIGFKKKKFKLKSFTVKNLGDNIYKLTLYFKRKQGIFKIKKEETIYFWIGNNKIIFLTEKGKFYFPFNSKNIYKVVKISEGYKIYKIKKDYEFKINVKDGKIYLRMRL